MQNRTFCDSYVTKTVFSCSLQCDKLDTNITQYYACEERESSFVKSCLKRIISVCWLLTEPLITGEKNLKVRMDDSFMLRYLRASEFKPKEAFDKVRS